MTDNDKMPVAIYQIDTDNYDKASFSDIVEDIVGQINRKKADHPWAPETTAIAKEGFELKIYSSSKRAAPSWQPFLKPALAKNSTLATCKNTIYRFLCFIGVDDHIYLITGGIGTFHSINDFVSQQFGLDILIRIIDKNSPVVKGIQDRGVTGVILGQSRYFRDDQRLSDDDDFGKIYKEVKADLQQRILVKDFKFSKPSLKRIKSGCLAKTSFKINKSIQFEELFPLTKAFTNILQREPRFALNKVSIITRKKHNFDLLNSLEQAFISKILENYLNNNDVDVDILHKDFVTYLEAVTYTLTINTEDAAVFEDRPTLSDIIREIDNTGSLDTNDATDFKYSVLQKGLASSNEDGTVITRGSVYQHLHGEITYENKSYFRIDEEWYQVHPVFIQDLNKECTTIIGDCWNDTLITDPFDLDQDEGEFNLSFTGKAGWLVLDTVVPDNIELCDLLNYANDKVYLVHVKRGFDNSLRDLTAQINIAAKRLHDDARNRYQYVQEVQSQTLQKATKKSKKAKMQGAQTFPSGGLKQLFEKAGARNIIFCLAVVDTAKNERAIKTDIAKFQSNIAKYFLFQIYRSVNSFRFDFQIIQLHQKKQPKT